jgi:cytochrome P450
MGATLSCMHWRRTLEIERYLEIKLVAVLIAGRDTTASALQWFFYELSSQPKVVEEQLDENIPGESTSVEKHPGEKVPEKKISVEKQLEEKVPDEIMPAEKGVEEKQVEEKQSE